MGFKRLYWMKKKLSLLELGLQYIPTTKHYSLLMLLADTLWRQSTGLGHLNSRCPFPHLLNKNMYANYFIRTVTMTMNWNKSKCFGKVESVVQMYKLVRMFRIICFCRVVGRWVMTHSISMGIYKVKKLA